MSQRILLTALGSLGDLHPYMAVGLRLAARGARVTVATTELYRDKIRAAGLAFHPVRPHFSAVDPQLVQWLMDPAKGPERVLRQLILPAVRDTFQDLMPAAREADLIVGHPLTFAVPLAAAVLRLPWVSTVLSPISFFSAEDPSLFGGGAMFRLLRAAGPRVNRAFLAAARRRLLPWTAPVAALRAELGLPAGRHPIIEGQHSPHLVLAMFSPVLATPRADWPPNTVQTGFAVYDRDGGPDGSPAPERPAPAAPLRDAPPAGDQLSAAIALPAAVERFLGDCARRGTPPLVFTLGSTAVRIAGDFWAASAAAARQLGRPALLVGAAPAEGEPAGASAAGGGPCGAGWRGNDILATSYLPYSAVLRHAAAVVHQGGIGTVGQTLAAGRPMLVVPFSHDQPDNAARLQRLGIARTLPRRRYTGERAATVLAALLDDPAAAQRAAAAGARVRLEDGAGAACAAIERCLASRAS